MSGRGLWPTVPSVSFGAFGRINYEVGFSSVRWRGGCLTGMRPCANCYVAPVVAIDTSDDTALPYEPAHNTWYALTAY